MNCQSITNCVGCVLSQKTTIKNLLLAKSGVKKVVVASNKYFNAKKALKTHRFQGF
jgi:hypothetical protein